MLSYFINFQKKIIFNFRKNDIQNGRGCTFNSNFSPININTKKNKLPICILNIGGISNITIIKEPVGSLEFFSKDIGPGNCLVDNWVRKNSTQKFDKNGILASTGQKNEIILEQAQELFANRKNKEKLSFDTNDFDISFARGLSLEDGAATLTNFTASIIGDALSSLTREEKELKEILVCGGGRKNKTLIHSIAKNLPSKIYIRPIDEHEIDGDFVESQAFAFLAIRSYIKLPISFPNTTKCSKPLTGGEIIEN